MTTLATNDVERLELIHETGYWRALLHATAFESHRIRSLSECWQLMEAAHVILRGWDYPHVDQTERVNGANWIESGSTFLNHIEFWRFYQSGQFVHHFALWEDRQSPSLNLSSRQTLPVASGPRQLNYITTLYRLTEILEFARGLAYRGVLEPGAYLCIELHQMNGRTLSAPPDRMPILSHVSNLETICWDRTLTSLELIADAPKVAIDAALHIFERFNWRDPPRGLFEEEQRRLLERRL